MSGSFTLNNPFTNFLNKKSDEKTFTHRGSFCYVPGGFGSGCHPYCHRPYQCR